jgi:hypothetical protein
LLRRVFYYSFILLGFLFIHYSWHSQVQKYLIFRTVPYGYCVIVTSFLDVRTRCFGFRFVVVVVDGDRVKLKPLENGDGRFYAHCDEW